MLKCVYDVHFAMFCFIINMGDNMAKYSKEIKTETDRQGKEYYDALLADEFFDNLLQQLHKENELLMILLAEEQKKNEKENVLITKERALEGSKVTKLSSAEQSEIYDAYQKGASIRSLSIQYKISRSTVRNYIERISEGEEKTAYTEKELLRRKIKKWEQDGKYLWTAQVEHLKQEQAKRYTQEQKK